MKKNLSKIFLMVIVSIFFVFPKVNASENTNIVDFTKKGSITITLEDLEDNLPINNAEISLYKIADATNESNHLKFTYTKELSNCKVSLNNLEDKSLTTSLYKCIKEDTPSLKEISNDQGIVNFTNLDLGLYLVKQTNKVEGYSKIDSFLVAIPKEENNIWIYDIEATPKTDIIRIMDLTVEKVWNSSNKLEIHPKSITVELYKGTELIDTITLNEENNWTHTWKEIEKSDEYKVKEINIPDGYTDTYRQEENKFIITNTKTLVQTGFNNTITGLLTILVLTFIVAVIIFENGINHE